MEPQYFDLLPSEIQGMVIQIEQLISRPIIVRERKAGDAAITGVEHLPTLDCFMDESGQMAVTIIYQGNFPATHHLAHEVMHAFIKVAQEAVWISSFETPETANWAAVLDNDIEHFYVVPAELQMFPAAITYWENLYETMLNDLSTVINKESHTPVDRWRLRDTLLRHWAIASETIPQSDCPAKLLSALERTGLSRQALQLRADVRAAFPDKMKLCAVFANHFGLDRKRYLLSQFQVRQRKMGHWEIPSNPAGSN